MHPSNGVPKKYVAKLNKCFAINDLKTLEKGVMVDGVMCKPTRVKIKKMILIKIIRLLRLL